MKGKALAAGGSALNLVELFASADRARVQAAGHLIELLSAAGSAPTAIELAREGRRIFDQAIADHRALGWDPVEPSAHLKRWRDRLTLWWQVEARLAELRARLGPSERPTETFH